MLVLHNQSICSKSMPALNSNQRHVDHTRPLAFSMPPCATHSFHVQVKMLRCPASLVLAITLAIIIAPCVRAQFADLELAWTVSPKVALS